MIIRKHFLDSLVKKKICVLDFSHVRNSIHNTSSGVSMYCLIHHQGSRCINEYIVRGGVVLEKVSSPLRFITKYIHICLFNKVNVIQYNLFYNNEPVLISILVLLIWKLMLTLIVWEKLSSRFFTLLRRFLKEKKDPVMVQLEWSFTIFLKHRVELKWLFFQAFDTKRFFSI